MELDTTNQQATTPAQDNTPEPIVNSPIPNQKGFVPIVIGVVILLIVVAGGAYYLGTKQFKQNPVPLNSQTNASPSITVPVNTITSASPMTTPAKDITWKTQTITIQEESAMLGKQTFNIELKIPNDWNMQTYPRQADSSNMIKNCSDYVITSPIVGLSMTLSPICSGWAAKYSSWPNDSVIALQQKRGGNDGMHNYYRVRYSTSGNNFAYADAMTDLDKPLDRSKDLMDAILIGYAPPNESKNDFFFIAAHLTTTYHPAAGDQEKYLSIADQITASITLR